MNASDPNPRRDGEEPKAPARLVAALKEPPSRRVFVPPSVDQAVLAIARRQLARPERARWSFFRNWFAWSAYATAIVVLISLGYFWLRPDDAAKFAREDLNRDGRVDILDAFQLAREAKVGGPPPMATDFNNDGEVDQRDAEFIAAQAVKLDKGGRS